MTTELQEAANSGATGVLSLLTSAPVVTGGVFFQNGNVVAAAVNGRTPALGRRLVGTGLVDPIAIERLFPQGGADINPQVGAAAVRAGFMEQGVLEAVHLEYLVDDLDVLLSSTPVESKFHVGREPDRFAIAPLPLSTVMRTLDERRDLCGQVWARLGMSVGPDQTVPHLIGLPDGCSTFAQALAAWLDGSRTLTEAALDAGFSRFEAIVLVGELVNAGVVQCEVYVPSAVETVAPTLPVDEPAASAGPADAFAASFAMAQFNDSGLEDTNTEDWTASFAAREHPVSAPLETVELPPMGTPVPAVSEFAVPAVTEFAPPVSEFAVPAVTDFAAPPVNGFGAPAVADFAPPALSDFTMPATPSEAVAPTSPESWSLDEPVTASYTLDEPTAFNPPVADFAPSGGYTPVAPPAYEPPAFPAVAVPAYDPVLPVGNFPAAPAYEPDAFAPPTVTPIAPVQPAAPPAYQPPAYQPPVYEPPAYEAPAAPDYLAPVVPEPVYQAPVYEAPTPTPPAADPWQAAHTQPVAEAAPVVAPAPIPGTEFKSPPAPEVLDAAVAAASARAVAAARQRRLSASTRFALLVEQFQNQRATAAERVERQVATQASTEEAKLLRARLEAAQARVSSAQQATSEATLSLLTAQQSEALWKARVAQVAATIEASNQRLAVVEDQLVMAQNELNARRAELLSAEENLRVSKNNYEIAQMRHKAAAIDVVAARLDNQQVRDRKTELEAAYSAAVDALRSAEANVNATASEHSAASQEVARLSNALTTVQAQLGDAAVDGLAAAAGDATAEG